MFFQKFLPVLISFLHWIFFILIPIIFGVLEKFVVEQLQFAIDNLGFRVNIYFRAIHTHGIGALSTILRHITTRVLPKFRFVS
jgi:hypothetical protein